MSNRSFNLKLRNSLSTYKSEHKNSDILSTISFPSKESKTLVKMQILRNKKTTKKLASDEKNFALSIFYKSPLTYKFLRNSKNINLPAEAIIKRWIGNSKFKTGFQMSSYNLK